ncbi:MAG TPA: prepilin-type N-terminal cleavage/methylation domain-containing protein [Rhodanobacter sp.]|nr:prepilin-type N-terminal cleavage/methylation domain-containing protein [Rhodanobacter sp.]
MKAQRGFTLMEVLGALALLALLLVGVYGGVRSAIHGVRSGSAAIARIDQVGSAQRFLRSELAQALAQPIGRDDQGQSVFFSGSEHEMRYAAPLPGYLGKLGSQLQVLRLVSDGKGESRLELSLALLPPDGQPPKPLGKPQVLLDHVKAGSFSYHGRDARNQMLPWADSWADGRRLPQLVRVRLQLQGGYDWPELDVPLRVDASAVVGRVGLLPGSMPFNGGGR